MPLLTAADLSAARDLVPTFDRPAAGRAAAAADPPAFGEEPSTSGRGENGGLRREWRVVLLQGGAEPTEGRSGGVSVVRGGGMRMPSTCSAASAPRLPWPWLPSLQGLHPAHPPGDATTCLLAGDHRGGADCSLAGPTRCACYQAKSNAAATCSLACWEDDSW